MGYFEQEDWVKLYGQRWTSGENEEYDFLQMVGGMQRVIQVNATSNQSTNIEHSGKGEGGNGYISVSLLNSFRGFGILVQPVG